MVKDINLRVSPRESCDEKLLGELLVRKAGAKVYSWRIIRRSIDARQRNIAVNLTVRYSTEPVETINPDLEPYNPKDVSKAQRSIIIVGSGPAGLFAGLKCLELGVRPIILERGYDVDRRRKVLAQISRTGVVDPNCNYSFGEGGAGTFSDGKLYTRSTKRGNVREVLSLFHRFGASEEVLVDAHPHIGTDRLGTIIRNMRQFIIEHGGEVRFEACVTDLLIDEENSVVKGVKINGNEELEGNAVILATGHSARDIYRLLVEKGVKLEPKGIAIGTRVEHPQKLIDCIQYHNREGRGQFLPPAEYTLSAQVDGRGVYSFCMCPGGTIVPAATGPDQNVVNGMSSSGRGSRWSNSGMVVEILPGDFPEFEGPLQMMHLQEALERKFYENTQDAGCENLLNAPAQRLTDFVSGRPSKTLPPTSYACGIHPARIDQLLPPFISERLRKGYRIFESKRHGYLTPEASLIGLESRTSAPVQISRDAKTLQHVELRGLYPVGEGAGYAGGIVSAALDGIRAVNEFCSLPENS